MATNADVKLRKLELKAAKEAQELALARQLIASPVVQLVGTVAIAEILESQGILSSRWAGALEGGVIAMVGLQALKDYGLIGAGTLGLGIAGGSALDLLTGGGSGGEGGAKMGALEGLVGYPVRYLTGG